MERLKRADGSAFWLQDGETESRNIWQMHSGHFALHADPFESQSSVTLRFHLRGLPPSRPAWCVDLASVITKGVMHARGPMERPSYLKTAQSECIAN
jgi:hypothetical protein